MAAAGVVDAQHAAVALVQRPDAGAAVAIGREAEAAVGVDAGEVEGARPVERAVDDGDAAAAAARPAQRARAAAEARS
ncbi:MAG: hypothetical protein U1F43_06500 [Myxococcota bacterium]